MLQGFLLQVEISQIIVHEADEPNALVSSACWCRYRSQRSACSSVRNETKSCRLRPSRSTDQTNREDQTALIVLDLPSGPARISAQPIFVKCCASILDGE